MRDGFVEIILSSILFKNAIIIKFVLKDMNIAHIRENHVCSSTIKLNKKNVKFPYLTLFFNPKLYKICLYLSIDIH